MEEKGEASKLKNTLPTVTHRGGSIMLWGCFAAGGTSAVHKIDGIMRVENYVDILKQHLKTSVTKLKLGRKWVFQMDNNPNYTSKVVAKWLKDNKVNVLEWPSQSPDLNPIENLWAELKKHVQARRPSWMVGRSCSRRMCWYHSLFMAVFLGKIVSEPTPLTEKQPHT